MKSGFQTMQSAKGEAERMTKLFKTPFSVFFDWAWDGINNWRLVVGSYKNAEFTTQA